MIGFDPKPELLLRRRFSHRIIHRFCGRSRSLATRLGHACTVRPESLRRACLGPQARLRDLITAQSDSRLHDTKWIVGKGRRLFEAIRARGMEGIFAKRLGSLYLGSLYVAGQRTRASIKVKVPGYAPDRAEWFRQAKAVLAC